MNLVGDPILADEAFELGLVNRIVEDHELLDTALTWARKLAGQAPLAVARDQARLRRRRPRRGDRGREARVREVFAERRRQGGHLGLPRQTRAALHGQLSAARSGAQRRADVAPPGRARRAARSVVALTGAGISVPSGHPRLPHARAPACGRTSTRWRSRTSTPSARDPVRFWRFYGERFATLGDKQPNGAHRALVALEARGRARRR